MYLSGLFYGPDWLDAWMWTSSKSIAYLFLFHTYIKIFLCTCMFIITDAQPFFISALLYTTTPLVSASYILNDFPNE